METVHWTCIDTPYTEEEYILDVMDDRFMGCDCGDTGSCSSSDCLCVRLSLGVSYTPSGKLATSLTSPHQKPVLECHSECSCKSNICTNRMLSRKTKHNLQVFDTGNRGLGLMTKTDICKGEFVCEYLGELISADAAKARLESMTPDAPQTAGNTSSSSMNYLITVNEYFTSGSSRWCIDARRFGNIARFINHSCQPNLVSLVCRTGCDVPRVALFACRDIAAGEELSFSYASPDSVLSTKPCLCGAKDCKLFLPFDVT
ncbi:SETMAR [Bugula neritina]|uniref:SETMAR n=1 Tax=Bugula neritina TaxID=10212 RepID=A0A7J7JAM5_BUGNE|nr:SETMAR [Bugula neritina]